MANLSKGRGVPEKVGIPVICAKMAPCSGQSYGSKDGGGVYDRRAAK